MAMYKSVLHPPKWSIPSRNLQSCACLSFLVKWPRKVLPMVFRHQIPGQPAEVAHMVDGSPVAKSGTLRGCVLEWSGVFYCINFRLLSMYSRSGCVQKISEENPGDTQDSRKNGACFWGSEKQEKEFFKLFRRLCVISMLSVCEWLIVIQSQATEELRDDSKHSKFRCYGCYVVCNVSNKPLDGKKDTYNFYPKEICSFLRNIK